MIRDYLTHSVNATLGTHFNEPFIVETNAEGELIDLSGETFSARITVYDRNDPESGSMSIQEATVKWHTDNMGEVSEGVVLRCETDGKFWSVVECSTDTAGYVTAEVQRTTRNRYDGARR